VQTPRPGDPGADLRRHGRSRLTIVPGQRALSARAGR
jgi:hypothetical protein